MMCLCNTLICLNYIPIRNSFSFSNIQGKVTIVHPPTTYTTTGRSVGDNYLTLSIVMTVLCCFCFAGLGLICTIPAIIFASMVRNMHVYTCAYINKPTWLELEDESNTQQYTWQYTQYNSTCIEATSKICKGERVVTKGEALLSPLINHI